MPIAMIGESGTKDMPRGVAESGYLVRTYLPGDERELVKLSNTYHRRAGVVLRDEDYWRWCCIARPGVGQEGVIIVTKGGEALAYAVVNKKGSILELCHSSDSEGSRALPALLERVLAYLKDVGADRAELHAPCDDLSLRESLSRLGFTEGPRRGLCITRCVNFRTLIQQVLDSNPSANKRSLEPFLIRLAGPPPPDEEIGVKDGAVLEGESTCKPTFKVEASKKAMLGLMFRGESALGMVLRGDLHVRPFWKLGASLKALSLLRLRTSWYAPLADVG